MGHLAFLEELEKPGSSLRQYCFRRFGSKSATVEVLHDLEVAYNDALNALSRFLSRRNRLISRFFPDLASNFSMLHSEAKNLSLGLHLQREDIGFESGARLRAARWKRCCGRTG